MKQLFLDKFAELSSCSDDIFTDEKVLSWCKVRTEEGLSAWVSEYKDSDRMTNELRRQLLCEEKGVFTVNKKNKYVKIKGHDHKIDFRFATFKNLVGAVSKFFPIDEWKEKDHGWVVDVIYRQVDNVVRNLNPDHVPFWVERINDKKRFVNVANRSSDNIEKLLSNFSFSPMSISQVGCVINSIEAFWQGLKHSPEVRKDVYDLSGGKAKGASSNGTIRIGDVTVFGEDKYIMGVTTDELVKEILWEKFKQNEEHREALLSTKGKIIIHYVLNRHGAWIKDSAGLPRDLLTDTLTEIRDNI